MYTIYLEGGGHCGFVVRVLATGPEVPRFKTACARLFQKLAVHRAGNGEGEGSEKEEWYPASVTPLPGAS